MQGSTKVSELKYVARPLMVFALLSTFAACDSKRNEYVEPPPTKVTVAQPLQQEVIDYLEFTGTTHAVEEVEVRARVAGFLESMHFTPGTRVEKDALLFVIDPRQYQAELNATRAELESARAKFKRAETEFTRAQRIFKQGAGSDADVVKWRGEREIARAAVLWAKAQVDRAQLEMEYTQVTAPITGRVSRNYVDIGNLVGEKEPTQLTTVIRHDPMYAYFNLNERDLLKVMAMNRKEIEKKGLDPGKDSQAKADLTVALELANEENYPHQGVVDFAESGVDPATGTLQLRGVFPNPGPSPVLLPGLFARLRLPIGKQANAFLVTERAVGADQGGNFLMTVSSDNVVEKRSIRMGQLVDGLRVIEEGLQPGDLVIVKGLQRARPGGNVDPEKIDMKALTTSAIKAAAEAKLDQGKATGASPKGDDSKSTGKKKE
jgi:multidrug efflux system membrane fusion protein